jgi:hypothetical protein
LSDWWPPYLRTVETTMRPSTRSNYDQAWRLRIAPRLGTTPVGRIRPSTIDTWIADMVADGVSSWKVVETVGVLERVLDRAVRDRSIAMNPCSQRTATLPRRPVTDHLVLPRRGRAPRRCDAPT